MGETEGDRVRKYGTCLSSICPSSICPCTRQRHVGNLPTAQRGSRPYAFPQLHPRTHAHPPTRPQPQLTSTDSPKSLILNVYPSSRRAASSSSPALPPPPPTSPHVTPAAASGTAAAASAAADVCAGAAAGDAGAAAADAGAGAAAADPGAAAASTAATSAVAVITPGASADTSEAGCGPAASAAAACCCTALASHFAVATVLARASTATSSTLAILPEVSVTCSATRGLVLGRGFPPLAAAGSEDLGASEEVGASDDVSPALNVSSS